MTHDWANHLWSSAVIGSVPHHETAHGLRNERETLKCQSSYEREMPSFSSIPQRLSCPAYWSRFPLGIFHSLSLSVQHLHSVLVMDLIYIMEMDPRHKSLFFGVLYYCISLRKLNPADRNRYSLCLSWNSSEHYLLCIVLFLLFQSFFCKHFNAWLLIKEAVPEGQFAAPVLQTGWWTSTLQPPQKKREKCALRMSHY